MTLADERKAKFIELVRDGETGMGAARAIGQPINYFYRLRKEDKEFAAAWVEAMTMNVEKRTALMKERSFDAPRAKSMHPNPQGVVKNDPQHRAIVLRELALGHSITKAAEAAGVAYLTVLKWRKADKEFEQDVQNAIQQGIDRLEDEARRRAVEGYEEQVINGKGEVVQTYRRYSDNLLALMLKSKLAYYRKPETTVNIEGAGGSVTINIVSVPAGQFMKEDQGIVIEGEILEETRRIANDLPVSPDNPYGLREESEDEV